MLPMFALLLVSPSIDQLTIGLSENPPYIYTRPDGTPAGFQVDVFKEAARREGIRLRWIPTGSADASTKSLLDGSLGLLPMGTASRDRVRKLYISEPWWTEPSILVTRVDRAGAGGKMRLALPAWLADEARRVYPRWQIVSSISGPRSLERLCEGSAEAALLGTTFTRQLVSSRPKGCVKG
jgi:ABC-type amino acid transport substrate-binding protein